MKNLRIAEIEVQVHIRPILRPMDQNLFARLGEEDRKRYGEITHERRKVEWSEGRRLLLSLPDNLRHRSLSHSGDIAYVAATSDPRVRGIGIDVEPRDRIISSSILNRLVLPVETALALPGLTVWTIKEASYKADPGQTRDSVLTDYEIINSSRVRALKNPLTEMTYATFTESDWQVAIVIAL